MSALTQRLDTLIKSNKGTGYAITIPAVVEPPSAGETIRIIKQSTNIGVEVTIDPATSSMRDEELWRVVIEPLIQAVDFKNSLPGTI